MKRKLELKDIAGYLPYNLKCQYKYVIVESYGVWRLECGKLFYDFSYKPILRPLSDLYRTITHNGKEIVPIVECAKMVKPNCKWALSKYENAECEDGWSFLYSKEDNAFILIYVATQKIVNNQYKLFDYLNELKIDYRGLIDQGFAIDANRFETNPYKP
jgi:hypothetical protein